MGTQKVFNTAASLLIVLFLALVGCSGTSNPALPQSPDQPPTEQQPPPQEKTLQSIGMLRPSFYWIALETNDGQKRKVQLLDDAGELLATVSEKYFKQLKMEGTGRLLDGRVINFHTRITHGDGTKEIRWRICGKEAPFGFGLGDIPLVPFKSVAVDPNVIAIGSTVVIPAAKGTVLPDGSVHDGVFTAVDIGDLIQNQKIDIFTSFGDQSAVFEKDGLVTGKFTEVFVWK